MRPNHPDALRWNARYAGRDTAASPPADILLRYAEQLPMQGLALDLACGLGSSALWLARRGLTVEAADISAEALAALERQTRAEGISRVSTRLCDLAHEPLAVGHYDLILVSRFLLRERCADIAAALRTGGLLAYQTWYGPAGPGPANPAFRLASGELERLFADLEVIELDESRECGEAMLLARRRS